MRIVLSSIGTIGQMHPMIALGVALKERHHMVTFCAPEKYRTWIMKVGFPIVSSGRDFEKLWSGAGDATNEIKAAVSEAPVQFVSFRDSCKEADVVVASGLQLAAPSITERSNIPYFYVIDHPEMLKPAHFPGGAVRKTEKMWNNEVKDAVNRERSYMHLAPISDLFKYLFRTGNLLITTNQSIPSGTVTGQWISGKEDFSEPEAASTFAQRISENGPLMKVVELIEAG